MSAPLRCPRCKSPAVKEVNVKTRVGGGSLLVETKGTMDYACGAQMKWTYEGNSLQPKGKLLKECPHKHAFIKYPELRMQ